MSLSKAARLGKSSVAGHGGYKTLVTGGAGFIGSHLVDRLVEEGAEVVVLDNLSSGRIENLARSLPRIQFVRGDIRDRNLLEKVINGVFCVFHFAAQSNVLRAEYDPDSAFEANVIGTY